MERRIIMKKIYGVVALVAMLMGATLLLERTVKVAAAAPAGIKNVVLVHGAFADGSGWEAIDKILEKDGYTVSVAQPPETSYAEDIKYAKAAVDAMGGPVVLVGHSYGGSIITEAGNDPNVAALVYIAAFALDEGDSCASIEQALPQASKAFKPDSNGNWWIDGAHFAADFAADIPPPSPTTWLYRRCRSPPTRSPIRLRIPRGRTNPPGTWWPPKTGRSIRIRSA
jgi:pimeloyl-ACP methyl ester carboxylesterase